MSVLEDAVRAEELLSEKLAEHVGEWVAVRAHDILETAPTLHELLEALVERKVDDVDGVFQVVEERGAASFF